MARAAERGAYDSAVSRVIFVLACVLLALVPDPTGAAPAAPGFSAKILDSSRTLDSRELIGKSVLVVRFQASYCKPCGRESAALSRVVDRYHTRGVEFIAFHVQDTVADTRRFIRSHRVAYPIALDPKLTVGNRFGFRHALHRRSGPQGRDGGADPRRRGDQPPAQDPGRPAARAAAVVSVREEEPRMRVSITIVSLAVASWLALSPDAAAQGPIRLGFISPLSGAIAQAGKDMYSGCELFWEEAGWQMAGRKLEVILEDNEGQPSAALTKARKLVESDKIHMLAGVILSNVAYALVPYVDAQGIPTIYPINSADDLTQRKRPKWLIRTGWNSGRVISSVSLVNTTSTGMSHRSVLGSASTLMRFDSMRGPSASSTMARTYGGGTLNALLNDW